MYRVIYAVFVRSQVLLEAHSPSFKPAGAMGWISTRSIPQRIMRFIGQIAFQRKTSLSQAHKEGH